MHGTRTETGRTPMIRKPTVVWALCLAWFLAGHEAAPLRAGIGVCGSLQLAKDGKTEYVIVTATAASRAEAFAAHDWPSISDAARRCPGRWSRSLLFEVTNRPCSWDRRNLPPTRIDVGKLGSEEWIIRSVDNNVVIRRAATWHAVRRPTSSSNAASASGSWTRLRSTSLTCDLDAARGPGDPVQAGVLSPRDLHGDAASAQTSLVSSPAQNQRLWERRRGRGRSGTRLLHAVRQPLLDPHHLYTKDFPTDKPDYFALTEQGHRTGPGPDGQVCMSHPDVRKQFASRLHRYIREDRERIARPERMPRRPSSTT